MEIVDPKSIAILLSIFCLYLVFYMNIISETEDGIEKAFFIIKILKIMACLIVFFACI